MKKNLLLFCLLVTCCCISINSFAQTKRYQSKNKLKLKPKEIKKLTFIQLEGGDKKFPDSYLLGMRDNNLILATDIAATLLGCVHPILPLVVYPASARY